jgi:hypothetical protein
VARLNFRPVTVEDKAKGGTTCGASPSRLSSALCEQQPGHWLLDYPASKTHSGRTQKGYWKHWAVTDEELKRDTGSGKG